MARPPDNLLVIADHAGAQPLRAWSRCLTPNLDAMGPPPEDTAPRPIRNRTDDLHA